MQTLQCKNSALRKEHDLFRVELSMIHKIQLSAVKIKIRGESKIQSQLKNKGR